VCRVEPAPPARGDTLDTRSRRCLRESGPWRTIIPARIGAPASVRSPPSRARSSHDASGPGRSAGRLVEPGPVGGAAPRSGRRQEGDSHRHAHAWGDSRAT
jgi:hypothetical protein